MGAAPKQYWPLGDHQNSVWDLAERSPQTGAASVVDHVIYSAFGDQMHGSNAAVGPLFGFTGRPLDRSTKPKECKHVLTYNVIVISAKGGKTPS